MNHDKTPAPTSPNSRSRFMRRRLGVAGVGLAGVALVTTALAPKTVEHAFSRTYSAITPDQGKSYTPDQLAHLPQAPFRIEPNSGAYDAVETIDPQILALPRTDAEVQAYVQAQGVGVDKDGKKILESGQDVKVPILPGAPTHPTPAP